MSNPIVHDSAANAGVSGPTDQPKASDTPITDALSTDPAIEKRDVPARVWRQMAEMERQRDGLMEALREASNWIDSHSRDGSSANEESAYEIVVNIRTLLARVEAK